MPVRQQEASLSTFIQEEYRGYDLVHASRTDISGSNSNMIIQVRLFYDIRTSNYLLILMDLWWRRLCKYRTNTFSDSVHLLPFLHYKFHFDERHTVSSFFKQCQPIRIFAESLYEDQITKICGLLTVHELGLLKRKIRKWIAKVHFRHWHLRTLLLEQGLTSSGCVQIVVAYVIDLL
jgi:hypothetical protein